MCFRMIRPDTYGNVMISVVTKFEILVFLGENTKAKMHLE